MDQVDSESDSVVQPIQTEPIKAAPAVLADGPRASSQPSVLPRGRPSAPKPDPSAAAKVLVQRALNTREQSQVQRRQEAADKQREAELQAQREYEESTKVVKPPFFNVDALTELFMGCIPHFAFAIGCSVLSIVAIIMIRRRYGISVSAATEAQTAAITQMVDATINATSKPLTSISTSAQVTNGFRTLLRNA